MSRDHLDSNACELVWRAGERYTDTYTRMEVGMSANVDILCTYIHKTESERVL